MALREKIELYQSLVNDSDFNSLAKIPILLCNTAMDGLCNIQNGRNSSSCPRNAYARSAMGKRPMAIIGAFGLAMICAALALGSRLPC